MSRRIKNVVIRGLTDEDNKTIRAIMDDTGCYQASKALMRCAYSYLRMLDVVKKQSTRIQDLELENHRLRSNALLIVEAMKKLGLELSKRKG